MKICLVAANSAIASEISKFVFGSDYDPPIATYDDFLKAAENENWDREAWEEMRKLGG